MYHYTCVTLVFFPVPIFYFWMQFPHVVSSSFCVIHLRHVDSGKRSSGLWVTSPGFLVSGVMQGSHSPYGNPGVPIPRRGATIKNTDVSDRFIYRDYL